MKKPAQNGAAPPTPRADQKKTDVRNAPAAAGWKLWRFRILAAITAPAILLGLLELTLRLAGLGYPTSFLLPDSRNGRTFLVQNNQFGWRFFGPHMSRLPYPCSLPMPKPQGTVRIFVFGESAAKGEPQPWFGLPRLLQAILSQRHPEARFEVVNAAMTAINSHAVRCIARDCVKADGDIWVISRLPELTELAGFCQSRGWFGAAAEAFAEAAKLDPTEVMHCVGAAQNLAVLRRYAEAERHSAAAVSLAPGFAEVHLIHGSILGQQGRSAEAAEQLREALRLKPGLLEARLNLGIALLNLGQVAEAQAQFEQITQENPYHAAALKYLQILRANSKPSP